jgi:Haemolysin-III related
MRWEADSVNIWSHLLGAVGFGILAAGASFTYLQRYPTSSQVDVAVFACFFGGAVACLGMSATVRSGLAFLKIVSYDQCSFSISIKMGPQVGLSRHHHSDHRIFLSECLLRILLLPSSKKDLLDDDLLHWDHTYLCDLG